MRAAKPVFSVWPGRAGLLAGLAIAALASDAAAQLDRLKKLREEVRLPAAAISKLFGGEPPLTTSLDDAMNSAVPSLDGFEPAKYTPLEEMPLGPGGTFWLAPGAYTFEAQSYCLQPGTRGAQQGDGYLYAELKGPKADLIRSILTRASDHPLVPQAEIQKLLWAILARARFDKMPTAVKATAAALLTPGELLELSSFGIPALSDAVRQQALKGMPAATRQVLEAEDDIRRLLASAEPRFEDLEEIAVVAGVAPPGEGSDFIKEGRWSYHPNGYFIRYFAITRYTKTRIQIYYPASFKLERDGRGRIISVTAQQEGAAASWQGLGSFGGWYDGAAQSSPLKPFAPGSGGSAAPGGRQRSGQTSRSAGPPANNAATKAQQVTSAMQKANSLLGPLGGGGLPNLMTGQLLNQIYSNSQEISDQLGGGSGGGQDDGAGAPFPGIGWSQGVDFTILSPPPEVTYPAVSVAEAITAPHAAAATAALASTVELTATLHAAVLAKRRFSAANKARNAEWAGRQAQALVHLKHRAGGVMVRLAGEVEALRTILSATVTEVAADQIRAAQRRLRTEGLPVAASSVGKALGQTEADLARYRNEVLALDPAATAAQASATLEQLSGALLTYGRYWQSLPSVAAPWP